MPAQPRYFVSTVEAMPRETDAAFVAIDEVQLAGDLERGHVFTDRILHLRGRQETLLLGAATMRGIMERLLRGVHVVTRPRLSQLAYAGPKKLTRLAAALGDRRLLRRRGLCDRRADPPSARRRGRRARRAEPAHAQRAGRALPVRRRRLPRRHRRDRHGPQPRPRPCRLRREPQVRRLPVSRADAPPNSARSPAAPGGTCATARSASPARSIRSPIRWSRRSRRIISSRSGCCNGAPRASTFPASRR